jgi:hypothetical protein
MQIPVALSKSTQSLLKAIDKSRLWYPKKTPIQDVNHVYG